MTESIITDEEVKEPAKTRREQDYEALIAKRKAELSPEATTEENESTSQEETKEPETIELLGEDGNPIKVPINAKYKAKVDGDEVEVSFDKLARSYQVGAAADKRMKSVSDKQRELEEKERALERRGQELSQKEKSYLESQQKLDTKKESGQIDDNKFKELSKRLLSALADDENDPEEAIEKVLKDVAPNIDTDAIVSNAEKKALEAVEQRERKKQEEADVKRHEKLEQARLEANTKFEASLDTEFRLLKEDEDLMRLAKSYANDEYHKNPEADPWEVIKGAYGKVVEFKKRYDTGTRRPPVVPKSVSARASIGEDKKPQTRSEILNEMKQARGQPLAL